MRVESLIEAVLLMARLAPHPSPLPARERGLFYHQINGFTSSHSGADKLADVPS